MFVLRMFGIDYNGLDPCCSLMGITSYFSKLSYYRILENVKIAAKSFADIKEAGGEGRQNNKELTLPEDEFVVSGDDP